jgi:hypothetical protein
MNKVLRLIIGMPLLVVLISCEKNVDNKKINSTAKEELPIKTIEPVKPAPILGKFSYEMIAEDKIDLGFKKIPVQDISIGVERLLHIKKNEFESTKEYQARVDGIKNETYYGDYTLKDLLVFQVDIGSNGAIKYKYDADKEEALIIASTSIAPARWSKREVLNKELPKKMDFFPLDLKSVKTDGVGQNAYGAEKNISITTGTAFGLASKSIPYLKYSRGMSELVSLEDTVIAKIKIPKNEAQNYLMNLGAVLVFQPQEPYIAYGLIQSAPTMSNDQGLNISYQFFYGDLNGIVIFDKRDSKIVAKVPKNFTSK